MPASTVVVVLVDRARLDRRGFFALRRRQLAARAPSSIDVADAGGRPPIAATIRLPAAIMSPWHSIFGGRDVRENDTDMR